MQCIGMLYYIVFTTSRLVDQPLNKCISNYLKELQNVYFVKNLRDEGGVWQAISPWTEVRILTEVTIQVVLAQKTLFDFSFVQI